MRFVGLLLAGLISFPGLAWAEKSWSPKGGEQLQFVLENEKGAEIGSLTFEFSRQNGALTVKRSEQFSIKKFLMRADVDQTATTLWGKSGPIDYSAKTIADTSLMDKTVTFSAKRDGSGGWVATANGDPVEIESAAWPMSLWHRLFIKRPNLFGLGGGEAVSLSAQSQGVETIMGDGVTMACEKYRVEATVEGREVVNLLWYEPNGRLCAMEMESGLGKTIYRRVSSGVSSDDMGQ